MSEENDVSCNLCGLSCVLGSAGSPSRGPHGLIDATVSGGYESTPGNGCGALDDMTRHRFSLCEWCLDWLFVQFKIPVAVDDPMNDFVLREGETHDDGLRRMGCVRLAGHQDVPQWRPAAQRVAEDEWRSAKVEFAAEKKRRDVARARQMSADEVDTFSDWHPRQE
jgi:hypothetical protein